MNLFILLVTFLTSFLGPGKSEVIHPAYITKSRGDVEFYLDYARFLRSDSLTYCEIYYLVNLNTLKERDSIRSFKVKIEVNGGKLTEPVIKEWNQTSKQKGNFSIDKFDITLPEGIYTVHMELSDLNSGRKGEAEVNVKALKRSPTLNLSDIEFLYSIYPGQNKIFQKFGLVQIPNPVRTYSALKDTLYFYIEIYHLVPDTERYIVQYAVLNERGEVVKASKPFIRFKNELHVIRDGIIIGDLAPGNYILHVEVTDMSTKEKAVKESKFYYYTEQAQEISRLASYYYFIDYIATSQEIKEFRSLSEEGKAIFLKKFWKKKDPTPETPINEYFIEFASRVKYADENFSYGGKLGRYTDMGRIYIKYGPPDERRRETFRLESRNREHWYYYSKGGMEFVFVDVKGTGEYELVYSSIKEEPTRPDWYKYVPPEEIERQEF